MREPSPVPTFIRFVKEKGWDKKRNVKCYFTLVNNNQCDDSLVCLSETGIAEALIKIRGIDGNEIFGDFDTTHLLDAAMINLGYVKNRRLGPKFHYCNVNWAKLLVFGPNGEIYPCPSAAGDSSMIVGRFLPELELNQDEYGKWLYPSVDELSRCSDCSAKLLCGGGCMFKYHKMRAGQSFCDKPEFILAELVDYLAPQLLSEVENE